MCKRFVAKCMYVYMPRFGCGWIYYGVILLTTNLVQYEHGCG